MNARVAGWSPVVGVAVLAVGSLVWEVQGLRRGALPWAAGFGALTIGFCVLGVLRAHCPDPSKLVVVGAWWTVLATLGVAGFMLGVGVGGVVGLDEENSPEALATAAVVSMAFGLLSFTPAQLVLAVGVHRARRVPGRVVAALGVAVVTLPVLLVASGLADGLGDGPLVVALVVVGGAWITIGLALRNTVSRPTTPSLRPFTGERSR